MTTTLQALIAARTLLTEPTHWCKGSLARDGGGRQVAPDDPKATQWCLVGVLSKTPYRRSRAHIKACQFVHQAICAQPGEQPTLPVFTWNDLPTTTHANVLAVLHYAIALARRAPRRRKAVP